MLFNLIELFVGVYSCLHVVWENVISQSRTQIFLSTEAGFGHAVDGEGPLSVVWRSSSVAQFSLPRWAHPKIMGLRASLQTLSKYLLKG